MNDPHEARPLAYGLETFAWIAYFAGLILGVLAAWAFADGTAKAWIYFAGTVACVVGWLLFLFMSKSLAIGADLAGK